MGIPKDILQSGARELGIELSDAELEQFALFADMLVEWNRRLNLTRITDPEEIARKHFLDSLTCIAAADFAAGTRVIDVGTGPGMPGIPLKIARPNISLVLLDSVRKKLAFVDDVLARLRIQDARTVHARAEDIGRDPEHREAYDIVLARALGRLPRAAELSLPLTKVGGLVLAMKGPEIEEEVGSAKRAIGLLGGRVKRIVTLTVPCTDLVRNIIVLQKVKPTLRKYPRSPAEIERSPL